LADTFFRASNLRRQMARYPRANTQRSREEIHMYLSDNVIFQPSKEIYYYERQGIIDQDFNGILVSRSIAARVFVPDVALLSLSLASFICSKYIPPYILSPPYPSNSISLRFNNDLLNDRIDSGLGKRVSTDRWFQRRCDQHRFKVNTKKNQNICAIKKKSGKTRIREISMNVT